MFRNLQISSVIAFSANFPDYLMVRHIPTGIKENTEDSRADSECRPTARVRRLSVDTMASGLYSVVVTHLLRWLSGNDELPRTLRRTGTGSLLTDASRDQCLRPAQAEKEYAEGFRSMYPMLEFWRLAAEYGIEVLPGSDAHSPEDVWGNTDDCIAIAKHFGLKVINDDFLTRIQKAP